MELESRRLIDTDHIPKFMKTWKFLGKFSEFDECKDDICSMLSSIDFKDLKYEGVGKISVRARNNMKLSISLDRSHI